MSIKNRLIVGNNLDVMARMPASSIDLIYADPPFNTGRDFGEFSDKWRDKFIDFDRLSISEIAANYHSDAMANYLSFMTHRLEQMHRLLMETGSLYLHCDSTSSHYLKLALDRIFGRENFRNEISWGYRTGGVSKNWWSKKHDVLFFYAKNYKKYRHNPQKERIIYGRAFFAKVVDKAGRFYADVYVRDFWDDIKAVINVSKERIGYPTQKPLKLLERIIKASSNEGDLILDPFCGSETSLVAAKKLKRNYIGIDKNNVAIKLSEERLAKTIAPLID